MAAPVNIRELRTRNGTTFHTGWLTGASDGRADADDATEWESNADKQRITEWDASGLVHLSEPDATLEDQLWKHRHNIPTLQNGNVAFKAYLEGANADGAAPGTSNEVAKLMSYVMGGIENPATLRLDALDGGPHTTTQILSTGSDTNSKPGMAVLVGTRNDGKANAEARVIASEAANTANLNMALPVLPVDTDQLIYSTTVYMHDTTQSYVDMLAIGRDASDQLQTLGCIGPFTLEALNAGEVPMAAFDWQCGIWQEVPTAQRDVLTPATAPANDLNQPAINRAQGGFFLADQGAGVARATAKLASLSIDPGVTFTPIPDPNGVNGICGFQRTPGPPTAEFTVILEGGAVPLNDLYDDFIAAVTGAGQQKMVMFQFGHTVSRTVMIDFQRFVFDGTPVREDADGLAAVTLTGHGLTADADMTIADTALANSPMRIHFF
jgi:hypothetical protein